MLDLGIARGAARLLLGGEPEDAGPLAGDLLGTSIEAERRIVAYTGLDPLDALPSPEAVSRDAWLEANLASMGRMLEPVAARLERTTEPLPGPLGPAAKAVAGTVVSAEVGALAGWLGRRVLGQYDLTILDAAPTGGAAGSPPPRLLMVAPNLREAARELDVAEEELVAWVCVHEVTHAIQFGAVGWLRPHLAGLLEELIASVDSVAGPSPQTTEDEAAEDDDGPPKPQPPAFDLASLLRIPSRADLEALVERVRDQGLAGVAAGPERTVLLERVQTTMAIVEGHAEHVMDVVGADMLPRLGELRRALDERRRRRRSSAAAFLERLLGLELKLRQYEQGKAFCDQVVARAGPSALHRVFLGPEALPSAAELEHPASWLERVAADLL